MGSKEGSFKYQQAVVAEIRTTIGMSISIAFC